MKYECVLRVTNHFCLNYAYRYFVILQSAKNTVPHLNSNSNEAPSGHFKYREGTALKSLLGYSCYPQVPSAGGLGRKFILPVGHHSSRLSPLQSLPRKTGTSSTLLERFGIVPSETESAETNYLWPISCSKEVGINRMLS